MKRNRMMMPLLPPRTPTPAPGLIFGWIALGMIVSLAIAFSGLEEAAQLPWLVAVMMGLVKSIEPWSRASANPHHTEIFFATMWLLWPAILYVLFRERDALFPVHEWRREGAIRTTLISIAVAAAFVAFTVFGWGSEVAFAESDARRSLGKLVLGGRFNTGSVGSAILFGTGYCLVAAGVHLYRTIRRRS